MNKRTLLISLTVGVVLAGALLLGWRYRASRSRPVSDQVNEQRQPVEQAMIRLHALCRRADSLGIDTTRLAASPVDSLPVLADKNRQLAMEMQYGRKPSRLSFTGLREAIDTTAPVTDPAKPAPFGPYTQLVAQYNRLRAAKAAPDTLRRIRQTLNMYRYFNRFALDNFVVVNIPSGELTVFDRTGKRLLPMQVIVGKKDKQTPCMATYISDIVTYPYWNVPKSIATTEMLPKIQRNLRYLEDQNLEVLDRHEQPVDPETIDWNSLSATDFPYRIRQASGCSNSLGLIKFDLANPFAIYLHDTNSRDLFTESADRFRSHGCVRVQKPVELANFVLGATVFDKGYMDRCLIDQKPKTLKLPKPFPVFIVYNTADVDAAGQLRFYRDIYALDK